MGLQAGASRVELRPELGCAMMGYGARRGTARRRHDPLFARALFLSAHAADEGHPDERALLVEADLCLVAVEQAAAMRRRIAERTGLDPGQILIGCVHTHSGPETGILQVALGGETPAEVEPLFDAVVEAGVLAFESAKPARLGGGRVPVSIGRNRRVSGGPLDPDALVLRVDGRADGAPLAVVYVHGCHPTALGHDNLDLSADWPGAASRVVEQALPGCLAIFALGPHADVDPRTRGLLDLAIPSQSVGVGFEEMEALGHEVGSAVAECALAIQTGSEARVAAANGRVRLATQGSEGGDAQRERNIEERRLAAFSALGLPPDARSSITDLYALEAERTAGLPADEVRDRLSALRLYLRDRTAPRIAGGAQAEVEVQVLQLGPLCLLALPIEVTVDVGREWRERAGEHAAVVSIANGWLRYLPHAEHFEEAHASWRYEILQSTFVPGAAAELLAAGEKLLASMPALSEERP